jgi:hypothetical protein
MMAARPFSFREEADMNKWCGKRNFAGMAVLASVLGCSVGFGSEESEGARRVFFRDIHRDGKVKVIGNFGFPVGQIITLEGRRARPSKTSNAQTLAVEKVDGVPVEKLERERGWPATVQVMNIVDMPEGAPVSVKGFEALRWTGRPDVNWHLEADFVVTEVLSPRSVKVKEWNW